LEPNRDSMQKPIGGRVHRPRKRFLQKRIANLTEKFDGDTQRLRAELILDLKSLKEVAVQQVLTTAGRKTVDHQNWARIAAYISQIINSIGKTYDIAQIKTELDELRKTIGELEKQ
jgi:hypothetical protein